MDKASVLTNQCVARLLVGCETDEENVLSCVDSETEPQMPIYSWVYDHASGQENTVPPE